MFAGMENIDAEIAMWIRLCLFDTQTFNTLIQSTMTLYTINESTAKKIEFSSGKFCLATFFKGYNGKTWIYNGGKSEHFKIQFLARKIYQYGATVYQKMQNSNIWEGMFSKKC